MMFTWRVSPAFMHVLLNDHAKESHSHTLVHFEGDQLVSRVQHFRQSLIQDLSITLNAGVQRKTGHVRPERL